jgi:hypothetical protein
VCWEFGFKISKTILYNLGIFSLQDMNMGIKTTLISMPQKGAKPKKVWKSEDVSTLRMFGKSFQQIILGAFFRFLQRI